MSLFEIRTDLALESGERFKQSNVEVRGVCIEEDYDEERDIRTTVVRIESENGAKAMKKPQGLYITIEAPDLSVPDEGYHEEVSEAICHHLRSMHDFEKEQSVLVVGLGNQEITPDALGPYAVNNLRITRHVIREYGAEGMGEDEVHMVSALVPGVMANTGMETLEIIKGVVNQTKPDLVIAIDALAARSIRRLSRTIQLTDAGVNPGSGVGNNRVGLNQESLGVPVIAIGVPTVVDAATIVCDAMEHMLKALDKSERDQFLGEMITPNLRSMFVTPKDVDETVKRLSYTVSEGINMALEKVKS
ncbi:MAG: GPR endopeptidase [Lachnospiraceae bacterium]|nr:GPR endopeptidase [Lachnospiraceae bacterium]